MINFRSLSSNYCSFVINLFRLSSPIFASGRSKKGFLVRILILIFHFIFQIFSSPEFDDFKSRREVKMQKVNFYLKLHSNKS